ncbi:MAG: type III-A CRISPR-associated protein Csm2 [Desulfamplus sp.]|nr:type III-A CRISPR-associated protein Csm2 [Desulfamplus sp.]
MSYFDKNGIIKEELLDTEAEKVAKSFIVYRFNRNTNSNEPDDKNSLSSAQLRRFFNEFRQLEKRVHVDGFQKVKPLIKMVKSKASYASNPKRNGKIVPAFKDFLINNLDKIDTEKDFEAFMLHFEAVVGFFYGMGVSNS